VARLCPSVLSFRAREKAISARGRIPCSRIQGIKPNVSMVRRQSALGVPASPFHLVAADCGIGLRACCDLAGEAGEQRQPARDVGSRADVEACEIAAQPRSRRQSRYVDRVLIGHRDKNAAIRAKYYQGGLMAIARHARRQHHVTGELCREIGVGAWLTLRGELSFSGYRGALRAGAKAWRVAR
jgi:hypothetical protein